jgi:hypothetical protein
MAKITIPIELPDDWCDKVAEKLVEKGCAMVVTRCQDCKYADDNVDVEGTSFCNKLYRGMPNDGFCNYGERAKE